ncbi:MAG: DUF2225 domain-containing protein [Candidatus Riflebacteria bacterium]|nr:DUF2225 domain-containing protein [Candidatus Riflebacteria bacterium]
MNNRRCLILLLVIALFQSVSADATRSSSVQLQCPICNSSISARELMSTNNFGGVDTDFLQIAMGASPILIRPSTCLKCGFSGYIDDFSSEAKKSIPATLTASIMQEKALKPAVDLASYTNHTEMPAWAKYDLIAQVRKLENRPAGEIAHQYLSAAWSVRLEDNLPLPKEDLKLAADFLQAKFADKFKNREANPSTTMVEIAFELLKIAESASPQDARAALIGSLMYLRQHGENPTALKAMSSLLPILDGETGKRIEESLKASIAREQGFQRLAIENFKIAINEEKNAELKARFCYLTGELHRRLGEIKEARAWFEIVRAIKERPSFLDEALAEVEPRMSESE